MSLHSLYAFGDSHIEIFKTISETIPQLPIFVKAESSTMFSRKGLHSFLTSEVPHGSIVILSYGEIDIRYRIGQICERADSTEYDEMIISSITDEYIEYLHNMKRNYGHTFFLYLPPPPFQGITSQVPETASLQKRVKWHQQLCTALLQSSFHILNINPVITLPTGEMNHVFTDQFNIHLDHKYAMIVYHELLCKLYRMNKVSTYLYSNARNYIWNNQCLKMG